MHRVQSAAFGEHEATGQRQQPRIVGGLERQGKHIGQEAVQGAALLANRCVEHCFQDGLVRGIQRPRDAAQLQFAAQRRRQGLRERRPELLQRSGHVSLCLAERPNGGRQGRMGLSQSIKRLLGLGQQRQLLLCRFGAHSGRSSTPALVGAGAPASVYIPGQQSLIEQGAYIQSVVDQGVGASRPSFSR